MQAADGVQCLLDNEATSSDYLSSLSRTDLVEQLWCLQLGIIADDHCQARHRIYFWKMLLRDDLSDELDEPEIILQPAGDAVIDDVTLYCRLDISHQPDCLSSWERLAGQLLMRTRPWLACKLVSKADASCHPLVVGSCFQHAGLLLARPLALHQDRQQQEQHAMQTMQEPIHARQPILMPSTTLMSRSLKGSGMV